MDVTLSNNDCWLPLVTHLSIILLLTATDLPGANDMPTDMLIPTMRLPPWVAALSSFLMIVTTLSAADEQAPAVPAVRSAASYVRPIILNTLGMRTERCRTSQELFRLYLAGAQRYVLSREDGAFPDVGGEHWRNIAERAPTARRSYRCCRTFGPRNSTPLPAAVDRIHHRVRGPISQGTAVSPAGRGKSRLASVVVGRRDGHRGVVCLGSTLARGARATWRTWSCFMPTASRPKNPGPGHRRHGGRDRGLEHVHPVARREYAPQASS